VKLFYSSAYVAAADNFDTTRKAQWVAASLQAYPIADVELCAPQPLSEAQLLAAHDECYVHAIRSGLPRSLAESQDLDWDAHLWTSVCAQNGGVLAAITAYASVAFLTRYFRTNDLRPFGWYCLLAGGAAFLLFVTKVIPS